jgi:DNA-binding response OmpR family regulator
MAKILAITDDVALAASIRNALSSDHHQVYAARVTEARSFLAVTDLVIAEVKPGQEVNFTQIYSSGVRDTQSYPVMVLLEEKQLQGFSGPVADFILKPLREQELRSRVRRLLDKVKAADHEVIKSGSLEIDVTNCNVILDGRLLDLTFTEYQLLKYLANHPGRVLTRESILDAVWGPDYFGGDRTVDVHIQRLRGKLDGDQAGFIQTVRNIGYRFHKT